MIDHNFVLYLKALGFVFNTERHEEYIDIIVSDKTTVEKNNSSSRKLSLSLLPDKMTQTSDNISSTSGSSLPKQSSKYIPGDQRILQSKIDMNTSQRMTSRSRNNAKRGQDKKESGLLILSKSHPKKLGSQDAKTKLPTKGTIKKNQQSILPYTVITTSSGALNEKFNKGSHGIHASTSSSTPQRNNSYKVLVVCSSKKKKK